MKIRRFLVALIFLLFNQCVRLRRRILGSHLGRVYRGPAGATLGRTFL
jgi:hypothetical protein